MVSFTRHKKAVSSKGPFCSSSGREEELKITFPTKSGDYFGIVNNPGIFKKNRSLNNIN